MLKYILNLFVYDDEFNEIRKREKETLGSDFIDPLEAIKKYNDLSINKKYCDKLMYLLVKYFGDIFVTNYSIFNNNGVELIDFNNKKIEIKHKIECIDGFNLSNAGSLDNLVLNRINGNFTLLILETSNSRLILQKSLKSINNIIDYNINLTRPNENLVYVRKILCNNDIKIKFSNSYQVNIKKDVATIIDETKINSMIIEGYPGTKINFYHPYLHGVLSIELKSSRVFAFLRPLCFKDEIFRLYSKKGIIFNDYLNTENSCDISIIDNYNNISMTIYDIIEGIIVLSELKFIYQDNI